MIRRPPRSTLFPYTTLFRSLESEGSLRIELVGEDGTTTVLRESVPVRAGEVVDATAMHVAALEEFLDRKSTRLNSSHANISYAVFCLKKKKPLSISPHPSCF